MDVKVEELDYSDYKVENISKDRANFSKLVLEKKHKIAVENMVLAFSFVEFLADWVKEIKGTEAVTDVLLADYFNISIVLSGLMLMTILEGADMETGEYSTEVSISEFPPQLVDSVCTLSQSLPYIEVKRVDDESVLCTYVKCYDIPEDLDVISSRIRHFKDVIVDEFDYLKYILGTYFNNKKDMHIAEVNFIFFTSSGFGLIMESLVRDILSGIGNEVEFTRTKDDSSHNLNKLVDTINSFDGFRAEWKGADLVVRFLESDDDDLVVRFLESDDDTSSTVLKESLSMATLCEDIKGTFLKLIGE